MKIVKKVFEAVKGSKIKEVIRDYRDMIADAGDEVFLVDVIGTVEVSGDDYDTEDVEIRSVTHTGNVTNSDLPNLMNTEADGFDAADFSKQDKKAIVQGLTGASFEFDVTLSAFERTSEHDSNDFEVEQKIKIILKSVDYDDRKDKIIVKKFSFEFM